MRGYAPLRRRGDFSRVRGRGRRATSAHLACFSLPSRPGSAGTRIGFVISTAVGNAVSRNRLRRRLRAIFDDAAVPGRSPRDVVIVARPGAGECAFAALRDEIERTVIGDWT